MSIRSHIIARPQRRIATFDDPGLNIMRFDRDNLYPNRMRLLAEGSGTAMGCIRTKAKFIRGKGFEDPEIDTRKVNNRNERFVSIKRRVTESIALHRGFCLHMNYNAKYEVSEIQFLPFEFSRLGLPDTFGMINKVYVWEDWPRWQEHINGPVMAQEVDVFNPNPEVVKAQVAAAGGISKYAGQVLYWTEVGENNYPLCSFDPVKDHVRVEGSIGEYNANSAENGFMPSHIVTFGEGIEEEAEKAIRADFQQFQGSRNANKLLVIFGATEDSGPKIEILEHQQFDGRLLHTSEEARRAIVSCYNQTPALRGHPVPGKLANSSEISNAFELYNTLTVEERTDFSDIIAYIDTYTADNIKLSRSGNYAIIPLSFGDPSTETTKTNEPN